MMKVTRLTPMGTAREQFLAMSDAKPGASPYPVSLPSELLKNVTAYDSGHELLYLAWELTRCVDGLDATGQRALMLLTLASLISSHEGSTRMPIAGVQEGVFSELLLALGAASSDLLAIEKLVLDALEGTSPASAVIGRPGEYKPLLVEGAWVQQARMRHFEERVIRTFQQRLANPFVEAIGAEEAIASILQRAPELGGRQIELSSEQQEAVRRALHSRLTVVSGGPGTGKTSIVVSILRALLRLDVPLNRIALAAPTGKAANRMEESIKKYLRGIPHRDVLDDHLLLECPPPQTLHRLLKYSARSDRFAHHENNPLAESVVIVDESSMIDLYLMDRLIRSVEPSARLILLGDAEQLPSVEAGAVFRDLLPTKEHDQRRKAAVRLTQSYRMDPNDPAGRNILSVANAINAGMAEALFESPESDERVTVRARPDEIAFSGAELLDLSETASPERFLNRWFQERIRSLPEYERLCRKTYQFEGGAITAEHADDLQRLFRHFEAFRILCLTRDDGSPFSAGTVNTFLHDRQLQVFRNSDLVREDPIFVAGEPVLMQRNDYERNLFNGDQGLILRATDEHSSRASLMAVFPQQGSFRAYHLESLRKQLVHAFAMTVHKSQGSEFDHVAVVLPDQDLPLLTREILYTAITRSKKSAVIVGQRSLLMRGAQKRIERFSGIAEGLA